MGSEEEAGAPPDDVISEVLSDRRRRYLLYCLLECASPVSLPTVADCVTEWELSTPPEEVPNERLRVYMSLYHDHLPLLEDADVVEYTQEGDLVELTERAEHLEPYLERTADCDLDPADRD